MDLQVINERIALSASSLKGGNSLSISSRKKNHNVAICLKGFI